MVRKQLYIEERQEQALKARARELGMTEAELVRQALDQWLSEPTHGTKATAKAHAARARAWAEFDATLESDAQAFQPRLERPFRREDAYDEPRFTRWNEPQDPRRPER